jgi:hypothetical protein
MVGNCTFSANSAPGGNGGNLCIDDNCDNCEDGGGIWSSDNALTVTNSIFSGNTGVKGADGLDFYGNSGNSPITLALTNNLISDGLNNCSTGAVTNTGTVSSSANLAPLGNYGGLTQTMIPLPGSAAIRTGTMTIGGKKLGQTMSVLLLMVTSLAVLAGLSGCGSSNGFFGHPQQTYTVTATVTAGSVSHSTTVTLTVK